MIDLRANCVAQYKMNDNAWSPWVAGLNGVPTELAQNGTFGDTSIWTWGNNWTWNGARKRAYVETEAHAGNLSQNIGAIEGNTYLTFFQMGGYVSGNVVLSIGGTEGVTRSADGYYSEVIVAGASPAGMLVFDPGLGSEFYIDNVFCICLDDFPNTGIFVDGGVGLTSDHSVAGKVNEALNLWGPSDPTYISVLDEGALEFGPNTQDFSVAIWIRATTSGTWRWLVDKADGDGDGYFLALRSANTLKLELGSKFVSSSTPITDTNWHLIIVVVNRTGNAEIYLDNVLDGGPTDISGQTNDVTNPLLIGKRYNDTYHFTGDIDVTRFYDKALSEAERDMLWHGGKGTERLISAHHHIYRGQDSIIDYSSPAAEMELDDSQVTVPDQELPANTIWHYIRRQIDDECGLESDDSPACIVAIDSNGDMIGSTPNPPVSLIIVRLSNGRFRLRWRYTKLSEEVTPTGFKIYMDSGSGFNFTSPDATIAYGIGGINNEFSWISGALTHGQIYRFCVRSYRTDEGESQNTDYVATDADSEGPAAITDLQASYEEI